MDAVVTLKMSLSDIDYVRDVLKEHRDENAAIAMLSTAARQERGLTSEQVRLARTKATRAQDALDHLK